MSLGLLGSSRTTGASPLLRAAPFVNCWKSSVVSVSQTLWVVSLLRRQEEQGLCCARASILHVLLAAGPEPAAGDPSGPSGPGFCSVNLVAAAEHPGFPGEKHELEKLCGGSSLAQRGTRTRP